MTTEEEDGASHATVCGGLDYVDIARASTAQHPHRRQSLVDQAPMQAIQMVNLFS